MLNHPVTSDTIDYNDLSCLNQLIKLATEKRELSKQLTKWFFFNGIVIKLKEQYRRVYRAQLYLRRSNDLDPSEVMV